VWQKLFGETATTKIGAIFQSEQTALDAAASIKADAGLQPDQVRIVHPFEGGYDRKLEPEVRGVARTAVRSHLILGAAGLLVGLAACAVLFMAGVAAIVSSPMFSLGAFLFFGAIGGLLLGGLVTARPDHQWVIQRVQDAAKTGQWALVIHPRNPTQCDAVLRVLSELDVAPIRSI